MSIPKQPAYIVIRNDKEYLVPAARLTAADRAQLEEICNSPEAYRRFNARLRAIHRREDRPIRAIKRRLTKGEPLNATERAYMDRLRGKRKTPPEWETGKRKHAAN